MIYTSISIYIYTHFPVVSVLLFYVSSPPRAQISEVHLISTFLRTVANIIKLCNSEAPKAELSSALEAVSNDSESIGALVGMVTGYVQRMA